MHHEPGELIEAVSGQTQIEKEALLTCAVVGPDDEGFHALIETVLKPTLCEIGFNLVRGGGVGRGGLRNLCRSLESSRWMIADMTGSDTSVAYALGCADVANCTTILLSQDIQDVPNELRSRPLILYDDSDASRQNLASTLRRIMLLLGVQLAVPTILMSGHFVGSFAADVVDVTVRFNGRRGEEAAFHERWNLVAQQYGVEELYRMIQSDGDLADVSVKDANADITQIQTGLSMIRIRLPQAVSAGKQFSYELEYEIRDGFSKKAEYWNYTVDCNTERFEYTFDFPLLAIGKFTAELTPRNGSTRSLEARRTRLPTREAYSVIAAELKAGDRIAFGWKWSV